MAAPLAFASRQGVARPLRVFFQYVNLVRQHGFDLARFNYHGHYYRFAALAALLVESAFAQQLVVDRSSALEARGVGCWRSACYQRSHA